MYLDKIEDYWNQRAEGYAKKNRDELSGESAQAWQERLTRYLPEGKRLKCLDMGCGPGFLGILMAKMGHEVTFADYSLNMLEKAEENAKKAGVSGRFMKTDAQKPQFAGESFDCVVSRNLVWNLENPETAYLQWLRILKKGGVLLVFDGNHYLHCFNEQYGEERKCPHFKDPHTAEYMQGVDPDIINEIALHLPLSAFERPKWDMEFFLKQRVKRVSAEPMWNEFLSPGGERKSVIKAFTLCVEK